MTDEAKKEIAELRAEVEALKAAQPKPAKTWAEIERENAEWRDKMHQLAEKRMSMATPPSVARYFADGVTPADCADIVRASHAPQGPSSQGVIPSSQSMSNVRTGGASSTPGWVDPRPLGPQPGIDLIDRGVNAALPHGPEWGKEKK
jgi:hypothetical protein